MRFPDGHLMVFAAEESRMSSQVIDGKAYEAKIRTGTKVV